MCEHCVAKIARALEKESIEAKISLADKTVEVDEGDAEQAVEAISRAGYHAA